MPPTFPPIKLIQSHTGIMGVHPSHSHHTASSEVSSQKSYYLAITTGGYSFDVVYIDVIGVEGPSTTHLSSHKVYCWLDGGDFVSSQSTDYLSMIHSTKYSHSYLLSWNKQDQYSASGDCGGGVENSITHFFSHKYREALWGVLAI